MSDPEGPDSSLGSSVRRVADSLVALIQNRASLFAVEFQVQRLRLLDRLFWMVLGLCLGWMGMSVATAALAVFLWRTTGYLGLGGLAVVLLLAGTITLLRLRDRIRNDPRPFAATLAEFEKDRACFRDQK